MQPSGVRILDRLGDGEAVRRTTTPVDRAVLVFDEHRLELDDVTRRLGAPMLNVRRITLDAILLEAAAQAGADIRTHTTVTDLIHEGGRVAGVVTTKGALRAPLVVGADGARSTIARLVGAREYHRTAAGRVFMWAYFEGADALGDA